MAVNLESVFLSGIIAAIVGAISGGCVSFLLDRRRESVASKQYIEPRKDMIHFINSMESNSGDIEEFVLMIGQPRAHRISPALQSAQICSISFAGNGKPVIRDYSVCGELSNKRKADLIRQIRLGSYDQYF
ncbi:MAG: hypothetical protein JNG85_08400 [Spirochaetaceae bacterium]|nr:hypothetical protein [Spirochaetaceae bacterium]